MTEQKSFFQKLKMKRPSKDDVKGGSKKLFWIWIGYQCIKGTLTTVFIWTPLIYLWLKGNP